MGKQSLIKRTHEADVAIGATIREIRKGVGRSQSFLAEHLGVTFQQVQKYEKGTNRIAMSTFIMICAALDVSAKDAFEDVSRRIAMCDASGDTL